MCIDYVQGKSLSTIAEAKCMKERRENRREIIGSDYEIAYGAVIEVPTVRLAPQIVP